MDVRRRLAEAKIAARASEEYADIARAIAETEAIEAVQGKYGSNDVDRKRFLILACARNDDYQAAWIQHQADKAQVLHIEAEIADYDDQRKQARLIADERHTVALERLAAAWEGLAGAPVIAAQGRALVATEEWFQR